MSQRQDTTGAREQMVQDEVIGKGVTDPEVIRAMRAVPRHRFVPETLQAEAYGGSALPIGSGQTISAPHMVALMTQALRLRGGEKTLEVGTGSGYQAAVLAQMTDGLITVERIPELAWQARAILAELGLSVVVKVGDGSVGHGEEAPYDRIIVTAATPMVPRSLLDQLAEGGILVAPVGDRIEQTLVRIQRQGDDFREESLCRCVFVPLLGREGFGDRGE